MTSTNPPSAPDDGVRRGIGATLLIIGVIWVVLCLIGLIAMLLLVGFLGAISGGHGAGSAAYGVWTAIGAFCAAPGLGLWLVGWLLQRRKRGSVV